MLVEKKFRQLRPIQARRTDLAWLMYLSGEGDERVRTEELVDILLYQLAQKDYQEKILLPPPNPEVCFGEYPLGLVVYPDKSFCPFGLREDEWIKHILITGMTGTGKTNLTFHILQQLRKHQKPFMVFDWKQNYRDLIQLEPFKNLQIYTVGRNLSPLRFNPLIPPRKVDAGQWLMRLIDVMKHAYFVGEGVEYLLREAINRFYEDYGVYDGSKQYSTFSEIKDYIAKKVLRGRMSLWQASTLRVLASLTFKRGLGQVVDTREQTNIEELLNQNVILELDALSDIDKVFFTEALIMWIYEHRKNEGKREFFKHALIIEEGHHILSKFKEKAAGAETIMETSLRQIREFGESVIVIDQEPNKLSNSIKANTYCKITFNLGSGIDTLDIAKCMHLDEEERNYIHLLGVGQSIISLSGRCHPPLFVVFPKVSVLKGKITDDMVKYHMKGLRVPPKGKKQNGVDR